MPAAAGDGYADPARLGREFDPEAYALSATVTYTIYETPIASPTTESAIGTLLGAGPTAFPGGVAAESARFFRIGL